MRKRYLWLRACGAAGVALAVIGLAACGDDDTTGTTARATTTVRTDEALSAAELESLMVEPPAPFEQQPDDVIATGLMEPGNPKSGTIAIGFAQEKDLVAAGLVRGWEKFFRAYDGAAVVGHVFMFDSADGPQAMVERFQGMSEPGFEPFVIEGLTHSAALRGTSPEGRTAVAAEVASGRFLIGFTIGGTPGSHDYVAILESLMKAQVAALPRA